MTSMDNDDRQGRTTDIHTTYCGFQVGQHVACVRNVNDDKLPGVVLLEPVEIPSVGRVYTVAAVSISEVGNQVCLTLDEIPAQRVRFLYFGQPATGDILFPAKFFRPLPKLKVEDFVTTRAPATGKLEGVSV